MTDIFKKAFYLLKLLARENNRVQYHIMERLDILLDVRVVESDLAIALKEVKKSKDNCLFLKRSKCLVFNQTFDPLTIVIFV